jgi:hypothetical protein
MNPIKIAPRGTRAEPVNRVAKGVRPAPALHASSLSAVPDPVLRDSLEDAPAWGGGIHTWCRCGCTGDEDHFRNINWRVDFPSLDE